MNNDDELTIYCARCGAEMKQSSRYCMKCGNLNYDHPDNAKYKKLEKHSGSGKYVVGSKMKIESEPNGSVVVGNNMGGKSLCFWVNMFAFLGVMLVTILLALFRYSHNLLLVVYSVYPNIWLCVSIFFVFFYGLELMYMKANKPWYFAFIPIYNLVVLAEMAFDKKIWALLYLVPFGPLIINYKLGEKFGNRGILTLLFGVIDYLVIGYSSSVLYDGYRYVESSDDNAVEKDYGKKSIMRKLIAFVFIASIAMFIASHFTAFMRGADTVKMQVFAKQASMLISKTRKAVDEGEYTCDSSNHNDVMYFIYEDVKEDTGIGNHDMFGYVKVAINGTEKTYSVYLTDSNNEYTLYETLEDEIDVEKVEQVAGGENRPSSGLVCSLD